jgi:Fur family peroxide stress response transcriptional regulator
MDKREAVKSRHLEEKLRSFKRICRDHGLRITPQRTAIYTELFSSDEHPSAITMYRKIRRYYPNISLGTVNSTLLTFAEIGLVHVVESSGDPKRFDPNLKSHHHFKCIRCGTIIDFHDASYDDLKVPRAIKRKYTVLSKKVHLEGLCDQCRKKVTGEK